MICFRGSGSELGWGQLGAGGEACRGRFLDLSACKVGVVHLGKFVKQRAYSFFRMYVVLEVALAVKSLPANAGVFRNADPIPGSGRFPRGVQGNPLQYSCLENPMDRGAWWATGVEKSRTRLKWQHSTCREVPGGPVIGTSPFCC